MRFIHAADIHLDSPLVGLSAYPEAPVQLLRNATRDAFEKLVSEALALEVDFLVIAGDLYDGNWKDFNTGIFFCAQMGRLKAQGIPVYLLLGNHDAESEMTRSLRLPENVHVFSTGKPSSFQVPGQPVWLHGRSFKQAATSENLALLYPPPVAGCLNIGVLHTALEGNAAHANYAPCSLAQLQAHGYQYWALGHVHEYQVWHADVVVAFPGNLQGRHIREPGPRGALLVTTHGPQIEHVERLVCDVLRWYEVVVDVSHHSSFDEVARAVGQALEHTQHSLGATHPLALRVRFVGRSAAHGALFGLEAQLRAQVQASAAALSGHGVWIEKIQIHTEPVPAPIAQGNREDALAHLHHLLGQAPQDEDFMAALQADLLLLASKMPMELQSSLAILQQIRAGQLEPLQFLPRC
jgi:DNA repair protein SbcD/Mre11